MNKKTMFHGQCLLLRIHWTDETCLIYPLYGFIYFSGSSVGKHFTFFYRKVRGTIRSEINCKEIHSVGPFWKTIKSSKSSFM